MSDDRAGGLERYLTGDVPESYPTVSLDDVVAGAIDRYAEFIDVHGPGDDWKQCDPEDLRAKARENLVDPDGDDYADALNYLVMARDARIERELGEMANGGDGQ